MAAPSWSAVYPVMLKSLAGRLRGPDNESREDRSGEQPYSFGCVEARSGNDNGDGRDVEKQQNLDAEDHVVAARHGGFVEEVVEARHREQRG